MRGRQPLGLQDLARVAGRVERYRVREVSEQRGEGELPPLQGEFPVVLLRWRDITSHRVEGVPPGDPEGERLLAGDVGAEGLLTFLQIGVKTAEDVESITVVHSFSLQPNRSEFFTFPRGVVLEEREIGRVRIEGHQVVQL